VAFTSLAFSNSGQPWISYSDLADTNKVTVMKYDSVYDAVPEAPSGRFILYPNPATNLITVDLTGLDDGSKTIEIYSLCGVKISEEQTHDRKICLDVADYPRGIYFIKVKSSHSICTGKFTKN